MHINAALLQSHLLVESQCATEIKLEKSVVVVDVELARGDSCQRNAIRRPRMINETFCSWIKCIKLEDAFCPITVDFNSSRLQMKQYQSNTQKIFIARHMLLCLNKMYLCERKNWQPELYNIILYNIILYYTFLVIKIQNI